MIVQYIVCECGRRGLVEWNTANVDQVTIDVASGAIHQECPVCRRDAALRRAPYRGLDDIRRDSQEDRVPEASVEDGAPGVSGPGEVLSPEPVGGETEEDFLGAFARSYVSQKSTDPDRIGCDRHLSVLDLCCSECLLKMFKAL